MTAINAHLEQNGILARLPAKERKFLKEHLDLVSLRTKEELNELGSPVRHVHFPVNCAISLMDFKRGGGIVEVAVVGKKGARVLPLYRETEMRVPGVGAGRWVSASLECARCGEGTSSAPIPAICDVKIYDDRFTGIHCLGGVQPVPFCRATDRPMAFGASPSYRSLSVSLHA